MIGFGAFNQFSKYSIQFAFSINLNSCSLEHLFKSFFDLLLQISINSIKILYQDEFIIIIEKPSGLLSVPYEGNHNKTALQQIENIMHKKRAAFAALLKCSAKQQLDALSAFCRFCDRLPLVFFLGGRAAAEMALLLVFL
jgi:23S rRNA-/tRNA-specific pseudouridylate synthase